MQSLSKYQLLWFFAEIYKSNSKIYMEIKVIRVTKAILKNNKVERLLFFNF